MGNVNGKITAPVDIWDPYSAIGAAVPSTGYNIGLLIATEYRRINKWAKYKPVPYYNGPFASSPNHPKYDPGWWKAKYPRGRATTATAGCCSRPRRTTRRRGSSVPTSRSRWVTGIPREG